MMNRVQGVTTGGLDAVQTPGKTRSMARPEAGTLAPAVDQTRLSDAAMAVLAGSSPRVAQLRAAVDSDSYRPSSAAIASRLVSGALAR